MTAPDDREAPWPGYALPPFHPAYAPGAPGAADVPVAGAGRPPASPAPVRPRRRRRMPDGAAVSGLLAALCVASLLAAIGLAAVRARC
ncbi:hypothetical protein [Streptomyces sp. NRRL B-3648]|uniref:hypothetical protein n=1 Tax=Streptomyces sp. NRRL B-3648 TaxID=1519493 RepID=UPI0006B04B4B|nr:hypothetical protein [Streptomyces sp. NRRL B-3648]KOV95043.1 hypothetical protein ADL04_22190 [Streptomyces sp. NRRL B-3648]